jgi:hypothetical protein
VRPEVEVGRQPAVVRQELLDEEDPEHVIEAPLVDGNPVVEVRPDGRQQPVGRRRHVEAEDIGPGNHELGHRSLAQLEDPVDHLALFSLDHALLVADLHQCAELRLRDRGLGDALAVRRLRDQAREGAQQEPDGGEEPPEREHGARHEEPEAVRLAHRDRHREHLADDDDQEDHDGDRDADAPRPEQGRRRPGSRAPRPRC